MSKFSVKVFKITRETRLNFEYNFKKIFGETPKIFY